MVLRVLKFRFSLCEIIKKEKLDLNIIAVQKNKINLYNCPLPSPSPHKGEK